MDNIVQLQEIMRERGFATLKKFLPNSYAKPIRQHFESLLAQAAHTHPAENDSWLQLPSGLLLMEPNRLQHQWTKLEFIAGADRYFRDLANGPIADIVSSAFGERFALFKDKINIKLPGSGCFPPHQDFESYRHYPPRFHVTAMLTVEKMDIENGCLQFATNYREMTRMNFSTIFDSVADNHLLRFHPDGPSRGNILESISRLLHWLPIETEQLDLLLFDSFVPHRSTANQSSFMRPAIFFTYVSSVSNFAYDSYYRKYSSDRYH